MNADPELLWQKQLEEFPDSTRVPHTEVMRSWMCDADGYVIADHTLLAGVLSAVLQDPNGVFYTCLGSTAYGYRYGIEGRQYYSFYKRSR